MDTHGGTTRSVLTSTSCDVGDFMLSDDLLVPVRRSSSNDARCIEQSAEGLQGCVLGFCEDGIVRLELVFLQQLLSVSNLDVQEGVANAEQLVGRFGHCAQRDREGGGSGEGASVVDR